MKPKDTAATNGLVKIDKNVPVPPLRRGHGKYPWGEMEVGDSFFTATARQNSMTSITSYQGIMRGKKFTTQSVTENGVKGIRVWRTE